MDSVHTVISDELSAAGVSTIFGLPGEDTIGWIADLSQHQINFMGTRHESAAVAMADGYSWAADRLGACTLTRGPGLLNAMTALRTAVQGHRRVLAVVGDVPLTGDDPGFLKNIDQASVCASVGARYFSATSPSSVLSAVRGAIRCATAGNPAVLGIPTDLLNSKHGGTQVPLVRIEKRSPDPAEISGRDDVEMILEKLSAASLPLILAGLGASSDACAANLRRLAEASGALLGTTLPAKGLFAGSPLDLGVVGGYASDQAAPLLADVDLVLAFGASLNRFTTAAGTLFNRAQVLHVDVEPSHISRYRPASLGIVSDCDALASALASAADAGPAGTVTALARRSREIEVLAGAPVHDEGAASNDLDPRGLVIALDAALPADRVCVLDGGRFGVAPGRFLPVRAPRGLRQTTDGGSIGLGLGVAMGAALGRPGRKTVLFVGDGGFSMAIADLETAARHNIPLTMCVMDDRAYGSELAHLRDSDASEDASFLPGVDFCGIARALGIDALDIRTREDLPLLRPELFERSTPLLIRCHMPRGVILPTLTFG
jgi:thiamine pyrophosphate-dependent acetolactate synthase large subunit-like protein